MSNPKRTAQHEGRTVEPFENLPQKAVEQATDKQCSTEISYVVEECSIAGLDAGTWYQWVRHDNKESALSHKNDLSAEPDYANNRFRVVKESVTTEREVVDN